MKAEIDAVLRGAVDRGEVPGIAFTAGNAAGTLYEGAFGRRGLDQSAAMTPDTVVWIASMTKAITRDRGVAAGRGRAGSRSTRPIGEVLPEVGAPAGPGGLRRTRGRRGDAAAGAQGAADPAAPADPYQRLQLRHVEPRRSAPSMAARQVPGIIGAHSAPRSPRRWSPSPASAGNTASASTGPGWRWRKSPAGAWGPRCWPTTCWARSACATPPSASGRRHAGAATSTMHAKAPDGALAAIPFEVPQDPEFQTCRRRRACTARSPITCAYSGCG